jgi:hypothetical protein
MLKRRALMESISSNLHCFLKRIGHNLSVPDKKFLRDGLIGRLRCGQVILSQANGAIWLGTDSVEGCLMTQLKSGRSSAPLSSQTCITDGDWHHISFTWNASQRHLYVDGLEGTNDTTPQPALDSAEGGLYFGAGNTLAPGTFFSGPIDNIRIYNRVISS